MGEIGDVYKSSMIRENGNSRVNLDNAPPSAGFISNFFSKVKSTIVDSALFQASKSYFTNVDGSGKLKNVGKVISDAIYFNNKLTVSVMVFALAIVSFVAVLPLIVLASLCSAVILPIYALI